MPELLFLPEVADDLSEASLWYEEHQTGLGDEFLRRVEDCLDILRRTPDLHSLVYQNYRRALVRRFPYVVFYEIDGDHVIVNAILHAAQDPEKWKQRTE